MSYTISKKKKDALYILIHDAIIEARINLQTGLTDEPSKKFVDDALSKLNYQIPEAAINLFKKKSP